MCKKGRRGVLFAVAQDASNFLVHFCVGSPCLAFLP